MNLILAATEWTFGVNDPSFIAWLICAVYFVAAILCWRARSCGLSAAEPRSRLLWTILSFALILLGLNKQLDLHYLVMGIGKELIAGQNNSPIFRGGIILAAGVLGIAVLTFGVKFLLGVSRELRWAYAALIGLLGAQVIRFLPGPISGLLVAHVFTEEEGLLHIHIIELLELGILAAIGYVARAQCRSMNEPTAQAVR